MAEDGSERISPAVGQLVLDSIAAGGRGELLIGLNHFTHILIQLLFFPLGGMSTCIHFFEGIVSQDYIDIG